MPKIAYQGWGIAFFEETATDYARFQNIVQDILKEKEHNLVCEIVDDKAGTMNIGFYKDQAILTHVPAGSLPPYRTSLNVDFDKKHPSNEDVIELNYFGESSDFYEKNFIPINLALDTVRVFWKTGNLSPLVHWVEE